MSYNDPAIDGTPTTGQPVSSQWGRDVQGDVEVEESQILADAPVVVNQSIRVGVLAAPTATVGTWTVAGGASPQISNTSAALNDTATWTVSLVPGTYDLLVIGTSGSTQGQVQFAVDGSNVGSVMDQFSASTVLITGITVSTLGSHTIRATVTGKNGGSSGYAVVLIELLLTRRS